MELNALELKKGRKERSEGGRNQSKGIGGQMDLCHIWAGQVCIIMEDYVCAYSTFEATNMII